MISDLLFRLRTLFRLHAVDVELDDELQFHFDQQVERYILSGMPRQEAVRQARLHFGGVEQVKEECRDARGVRSVEILAQDVRYGLRILWKQPVFTAAAVTILGLGIGANTAIFSVIDAVLLRPLPFRDPARVVVLTEYNAANHVEKTGASYPDYRVWAERSRTFEQLAAYWNVSGDGMVLGGSSSPERAGFSIVTHSFFPLLGVSPVAGRTFVADDDTPGGPKVFLASDALWKRNLGGTTDAIGKTFRLDGDSFTLIGILPPAFSFPRNCDLWLPLGALTSRQLADRVSHPFWALARLQPGAGIQRGQAEMNLISDQLSRAYPLTNANWAVKVTPLIDEFAGNIRASLIVLFAAVVFILLIACASVANLVLARSETRQKEFALRAALGATRARLVCQTLIESFVIALISTGLALLFGFWGLHAIASVMSGSLQRLDRFHLDGWMLVFAAALAVTTTVLIGLSPALQFSAACFQDSIRQGPRAGVGPRSQRVRNFLVVVEISITLVLLCGAGLMLRSFQQIRKVDPGFNPERVITMRIALPELQYPKVRQREQFLDSLLARLRQLPGVEAVAAANTLPLTGVSNWESISIAGSPVIDWARAPSVELRNVSAAYFRAMGIRLVRGREFQEAGSNDRFRVVVINQHMADQFWPGVDPIGQRLSTIDEPNQPREVVGVVANVKHFGLDAENDSEMYVPYAWWSSMHLIVRGASGPSTLIPAVRHEVAALDQSVPVYDAATMDFLVSRSVVSRRLDLYLLASFAALALILSAVGIYGLLAFGVNSRQQEIGVRLALGAAPAKVLKMIIWDGMRLVITGLVIGLLASLALTRLMASLLFQVSATDPLIFGCVALLLLFVSILACWLPARRATHLDPMMALRFQ